MEKVDLNQLSPEQLAELEEQLKAKKANERKAKEAIKADFEELKDGQVQTTFEELKVVSKALSEGKADIYDQFGVLLKMKQELHGLTDIQMAAQQSHTFTSKDGRVSIIIGNNVIDGWSDDVGVGVGMVQAWLDKLQAKMPDADTRKSVGYMRDLLKPDKDGILKANRILDLSKKAHELEDDELVEAVDFIRDQYRPAKTSTFIKVKFKNDKEVWEWLPLSMSSV